jgi:peptidyl-prolyl cis-trans isomerase B (cyclophilin B)
MRSLKHLGNSAVGRIQHLMKSRRGKIILCLMALKWVVVLFFFSFLSSPSPSAAPSVAPASTDPIKQDTRDLTSTEDAQKSQDAPLLSTIVTTRGSIVVEFLPNAAPKTVENFVQLITMGFWNNDTHFYRYEPNFVLQGGGWPIKGSPLPPVPLEYNLPNAKYFISTARTADPNSATCEFSIMINDNSKWLGPGGSDKFGYAVFAKVVGGFDVIESFAGLPAKANSGLRVLDPPVRIISWTLNMN